MLHPDHIKKGWKTSLAGLVMAIGSIVSVFLPELEISWAEVMPGLLFSMVLLGIKDPNAKKDERKAK
ncbi:hypothetical protein [Xanthovirga aplysinae]|uniref:hypothetical protein n=1 Tax=Xanthovirga aplysinae TaxID=2529853 RepID=UPI0012BC221C|nr:hypothetical protein [Xanthovirga aplysinae]MTI31462.1 hypothetical protein [Xanthovirga aplysinae]